MSVVDLNIRFIFTAYCENNKNHPDTQTEQRRLISVQSVEKCLAERQNTHSPFRRKVIKTEISEKPLSLRKGKLGTVKINKFETSQQCINTSKRSACDSCWSKASILYDSVMFTLARLCSNDAEMMLYP